MIILFELRPELNSVFNNPYINQCDVFDISCFSLLFLYKKIEV